MSSAVSTYLETSLFVAMVSSVCFALILFLIKLPQSEHTQRLSWTKSFIGLCYLACAVVFVFALSHRNMENFELFASMMTLVVTGVSACVLSYSLINLIDDAHRSKDVFYLNITLVAIASFVLARLIIAGPSKAMTIAIWTYIVIHALQCTAHIIIFDRVFKKSKSRLSKTYDEDTDNRLRWIRFCYIIMMLTEAFVLVYLLLPRAWMVAYVYWYVLFMLYFTSNFISFLGSHKLVLDTFARQTLAGQELRLPKIKSSGEEEDVLISSEQREKEFRTLERRLDKWVEDKKYREYDKSREEIARQLKTSKETLALYFATKKGIDFRTWRTALRVEDAKKLLLENSEVSIQYIADLTGFSDRSNFHRQFTKIAGCSPKEWRETGGHPEVLSK